MVHWTHGRCSSSGGPFLYMEAWITIYCKLLILLRFPFHSLSLSLLLFSFIPSLLYPFVMNICFLGGSVVRNLPAVQKTQVRYLGWEDPLEKDMATHSSILAWRILWREQHSGLQPMGLHRVGHDWAINTFMNILSAISDPDKESVSGMERLNHPSKLMAEGRYYAICCLPFF